MKIFVAVALIVVACGPGVVTTAPLSETNSPLVLGSTAQPSTMAPSQPREGVFGGSRSGQIAFGRDFDKDTLLIIEPLTQFPTDVPEVAWSASLSEEVHTSEIDIVITQRGQGSERTIWRQAVHVSNRRSNRFASKVDIAGLVDHRAGIYWMAFIRFDEGLAEGTFTLVDGAASASP